MQCTHPTYTPQGTEMWVLTTTSGPMPLISTTTLQPHCVRLLPNPTFFPAPGPLHLLFPRVGYDLP